MARLDTPRTLRDRLYKTFRTRAPARAERMTGLSRPDVDDDGVPLAEEDVSLRNRRLEALVTGRVIGERRWQTRLGSDLRFMSGEVSSLFWVSPHSPRRTSDEKDGVSEERLTPFSGHSGRVSVSHHAP